MIRITPHIAIGEGEISYEFIRSSGPGGQNVNKVSTAVQLRFDVANSPTLACDVQKRLIQLAGRRITRDGVLIIEARRFRKQEQNRQDALDRLVKLVLSAAVRPKPRRRTKPSHSSKMRRMDNKSITGRTKKMRQTVLREDES